MSEKVICGLTTCISGSAPGLTLGSEYGITVFLHLIILYDAAIRMDKRS